MMSFEEQAEERLGRQVQEARHPARGLRAPLLPQREPRDGPGVQRAPRVLRRRRAQLRRGGAPVPRLPALRRGRPHGVARLSRAPRQPGAAFARGLGLGDFLLLGRGEEAAGGRERAQNLASLFEAVVGAIAIDRGLTVAQQFIFDAIGDEIDLHRPAHAGRPEVEAAGGRAGPLAARTDAIAPCTRRGPSTARSSRSRSRSRATSLGSGTGHSKQEAEREAAKAALATYPFELADALADERRADDGV